MQPVERKIGKHYPAYYEILLLYCLLRKLHIYSNYEMFATHIRGKVKMIKHEYNVLKSFTIYTDESRKRTIGTNKNEKKNGSTFTVRSLYVDYRFPDKNIKLAAITKDLVKKKFVKLARLIRRGRDRKTT